jgi:hypothetical protein
MPSHKSTQLAGHGLQAEGKPYTIAGSELIRVQCGRHGRGLCSCGAASEVLPTDAARKRWHAAHKDQERQRQEQGDG